MPPRPRPIRRGAPAARSLAGATPKNGTVQSRGLANANTRMTPAAQQATAGEVEMTATPSSTPPPGTSLGMREVFTPTMTQRVRPAGTPAASVPVPLAHRVDAQNQEVLRRMSALESLLAKQQSAIDHLTQLLHEAYGLSEPETPSLDDEFVSSTQSSEFGGVAAGDAIEPSAEQFGEEATSEDVVAEAASE